MPIWNLWKFFIFVCGSGPTNVTLLLLLLMFLLFLPWKFRCLLFVVQFYSLCHWKTLSLVFFSPFLCNVLCSNFYEWWRRRRWRRQQQRESRSLKQCALCTYFPLRIYKSWHAVSWSGIIYSYLVCSSEYKMLHHITWLIKTHSRNFWESKVESMLKFSKFQWKNERKIRENAMLVDPVPVVYFDIVETLYFVPLTMHYHDS